MAATTTAVGRPRVAGDTSLEHLLPQQWDENNWPLAGSSGSPLDGEAATGALEARAARLHRLGNLTIVAHQLNPAMSNAAWTTKKDKLNEHSVLLLNSRLTTRDTWDHAAIDERGDWLAHRMAEIWPGPDSAVRTSTNRL